MLGSINPLGERARGSRWPVTVSALLIGSATGGAALGGILGWLGGRSLVPLGISEPARMWVLLGLIALGLSLDAGLLGPRLPGPRRQVNDEWLYRYRGWVYGLGFGFQLGVGFLTVVQLSAVYAAFAAAFLSGSFTAGLAIGASFGTVRASTAVSVARVRRADQLAAVDGRLRRWDAPSRRLAIGVECGLVAACLPVLLG